MFFGVCYQPPVLKASLEFKKAIIKTLKFSLGKNTGWNHLQTPALEVA